MTTRQLVNTLQTQGYDVSYRIRKDGGVLITSINGHKYQGATGNRVARMLVGEKISERRKAQLKKITRERVQKPRKIKIETPEDLERFRKRVMRKWRKAGLTGSISKKNLRRIIEDRGIKGAETYLQEMERHTEGKAYYGEIETLLLRIQEDIAVETDSQEQEYLQVSYDLINEKKDSITHEMIVALFDKIYDYEMPTNQTTAHDFYLSVYNLLK